MEFNKTKEIIKMLQQTRAFVAKGLTIDKNPPKDVEIFLENLKKLQSAAEKVINDNDLLNFLSENSEELTFVVSLAPAISPNSNYDKNSSENTCHHATDNDSFEIEEEDDVEEEKEDENIIEENNIYREWFAHFLKNSLFEKLTEEQKENVEFILQCFGEYLEYVDADDPADWNTGNISELCLEIFPRKITAEISLFKCIGPVLIAFFNFLSENQLLKQAWKLSNCIKTIQVDIVKKAADSRNWGMAKTIAMKAHEENVDLSDPIQNERFIRQFNQISTMARK